MPKSDALHYNPCPNAWTRQLDEARAATSPFTAEHKDALEQQQSDDRLDPTVNIQPNHSPADSLTVNPTASAAMEGPGGGGGGGGNVQAEAEHGKCNGHGADEGDWRCASWDDERMPPALEPPGTAAPADGEVEVAPRRPVVREDPLVLGAGAGGFEALRRARPQPEQPVRRRRAVFAVSGVGAVVAVHGAAAVDRPAARRLHQTG